jgi:hypothetical protein
MQFKYKDIDVTVLNNGGKEAVSFIHSNTPSPIREVSGDRVEFQIGTVKYIYHVQGVSLNQITGANEVLVELIMLNVLSDGSLVVIQHRPFNYSASPVIFEGMSQLQSLPESTILKTMFMHFLNGILSRIPELGGTQQGWGVELFNNDGTVDEPLYTYNTLQGYGTLNIVPIVESPSWKLFVNGEEWLVDETVITTTQQEVTREETDETTGETTTVTTTEDVTTTSTEKVQSLHVTNLVNAVNQVEYQILDEDGTVLKSQIRNVVLY